MDGERFDALTRALAAAASRRNLFKGAALALGGLAPFARARLATANATCGIACAGDGDCANSEDNCFACCGGVCVSALNDVNNCNGCGIVCPGGSNASCSRGSCLLHCPAGLTACGDNSFCADLTSDINNCQTCGNACTAPSDACCPAGCVWLEQDDLSCGACGNACGAGLNCCAGQCIDLSSATGSCGACGNACAADQVCTKSACAARCPAGRLFCDPNCVDAQTDAGNCGACGNACAADQRCQGGTCVSRCPDGQLFCDPNCVNAQSDAANCGSCGAACPGGQLCQGGGCVSTCAAGQTACGGACVDLANDAANCGSCGNACAAEHQCQRGGCVARCPADQFFCDPNCVNAQSDAANCGGCGVVCAGGQLCQGGACVSTCAAGQTDCNGVCVDLTGDRINCGGCGAACSRDTSCVNGACMRAQCPHDQTQCQDGCVDVKTDANHCGGCHNACVGGTTCCGGACVDLKTDPKHCGRCDFACPPGYECDGKGCVLQSSGTETVGSLRTARPELCVTKARTEAELSALLASAIPTSPTPTATPSAGPTWKQITKGARIKAKAASSALTQTITDAVVQVSACGSANDPARQTALMTDAMAARWLGERHFTPAQVTTIGQTTPAPLPPQSWARIATIDQVFELGKNVVNALVTYAPVSSAIPARREVHVFTKHANGWLLDAVRRADQFTAKTGSLALRLFDCPAGVSPSDPGAACAPTPELQFGYELASVDGKVRKSLADATFLDEGLLMWNALPPGPYDVIVSVPAGSGVTTVITGDQAAINRPVFIVPSGRDAIVVNVFHERTALSDIILHLQVDAHCGPCSQQDPVRAICVPTCPPCSTCSSVARVDHNSVSFCRSLCAADQVCHFDDRFPGDFQCCVPTGGACTTAAHCCEGSCQNGVCACTPDGAYCAPGGCCAGSVCGVQKSTCRSCKPVGLACASSDECCGNSCFDGVCRCCAGVENNDYTKTHLCCAFPYALMEINDSPLGPGFKRCCAIGVDCIGDPQGPPLRSDNYGFTWAPVACGPTAAPGQVCANNEPKCPLPNGPACCDPDPAWGNAICVRPNAKLGDFACVQADICPAGAAVDPTTRVCVCPDGRGACPGHSWSSRAGDPPYYMACCAAGKDCLPVQNNLDHISSDDGFANACCPAGTLAFWEPGAISFYERCFAPNDPRVCGKHLCDVGKTCVNGACA